MAIAAAVILPLGFLFLLSGLIVNFIQVLLFVLIRPLSKNIYRRINKEVTELLWLEVVWLFDWWANIKVELYIDPEMWDLMGKEHALLISNHQSDIDWLVGWVLAQRFGCLGSSLALIKKSAMYLPNILVNFVVLYTYMDVFIFLVMQVLGWSMWFAGYVFLERCWIKDENTLKSGLKNLCDYPRPFWLGLFVEGTRFTQAKLLAAQEYAASTGLPVPRNVLIPRTKGFVTAVSELRSFVPAIYNVTVAIPKNEPRPTMLRIFRGRSSVVHVHIERHLMAELPLTGSGIAQWCKDIFVAKDALLERHLAKDTFGNKQCHDIGRPMKSLLVAISWSCFLIFCTVKFFEWCPFSWSEIAFCTVFLVLVVILVLILVVFSQSEHSSQANPLQERLLQR